MVDLPITKWIKKKIRRLIAIVEDTDVATHSIASGKYVVWKGDLHKSTAPIAVGGALSLSNLSPVSDGGLNELSEQISSNVITARGSITIASGSVYGTGYVNTPTNINATKYWWVGCVSPDSGGNDYESVFVERCWANASNVSVRVNRQLRNNTSGAITVPVAIIGVYKG